MNDKFLFVSKTVKKNSLTGVRDVNERVQRGRDYFRAEFTRRLQFHVEHVQSVLHETTANDPITILLGYYVHTM